jgi:predicted phage gp36 major capsid-like protein
MIQMDPNSLAGYPLATTNQMPVLGSPATDHVLIFGRWSDILLGYWSVFDLLVNPYESTAYSKGNVSVRGIVTMDVAIRHIESSAASIDVGV